LFLTFYFYEFIAALPFFISLLTQFIVSLLFLSLEWKNAAARFFNCPTIITALIIFSCGLLVFSLAVGFGELYKYVPMTIKITLKVVHQNFLLLFSVW